MNLSKIDPNLTIHKIMSEAKKIRKMSVPRKPDGSRVMSRSKSQDLAAQARGFKSFKEARAVLIKVLGADHSLTNAAIKRMVKEATRPESLNQAGRISPLSLLEDTVAIKESGTLRDVLVVGRSLDGGLKTIPKKNGDLFVVLGENHESIRKIGSSIIMHELLANGGGGVLIIGPLGTDAFDRHHDNGRTVPLSAGMRKLQSVLKGMEDRVRERREASMDPRERYEANFEKEMARLSAILSDSDDYDYCSGISASMDDLSEERERWLENYADGMEEMFFRQREQDELNREMALENIDLEEDDTSSYQMDEETPSEDQTGSQVSSGGMVFLSSLSGMASVAGVSLEEARVLVDKLRAHGITFVVAEAASSLTNLPWPHQCITRVISTSIPGGFTKGLLRVIEAKIIGLDFHSGLQNYVEEYKRQGLNDDHTLACQTNIERGRAVTGLPVSIVKSILGRHQNPIILRFYNSGHNGRSDQIILGEHKSGEIDGVCLYDMTPLLQGFASVGGELFFPVNVDQVSDLLHVFGVRHHEDTESLASEFAMATSLYPSSVVFSPVAARFLPPEIVENALHTGISEETLESLTAEARVTYESMVQTVGGVYETLRTFSSRWGGR